MLYFQVLCELLACVPGKPLAASAVYSPGTARKAVGKGLRHSVRLWRFRALFKDQPHTVSGELAIESTNLLPYFFPDSLEYLLRHSGSPASIALLLSSADGALDVEDIGDAATSSGVSLALRVGVLFLYEAPECFQLVQVLYILWSCCRTLHGDKVRE